MRDLQNWSRIASRRDHNHWSTIVSWKRRAASTETAVSMEDEDSRLRVTGWLDDIFERIESKSHLENVLWLITLLSRIKALIRQKDSKYDVSSPSMTRYVGLSIQISFDRIMIQKLSACEQVGHDYREFRWNRSVGFAKTSYPMNYCFSG